ncbi:MAG: LytTR family DNA-binding domain-containing protein [Planctomycetota bacterium]
MSETPSHYRPRLLIVDDERLARVGLRRLVDEDGRCDVVAECRDGAEAIDSIERLSPDIVLLDIEMPEKGAFEVLHAIGRDTGPAIILVTAHADHGLEAFDAGVVDYVLKPVDPARLRLGIDRGLRRLEKAAPGRPSEAESGKQTRGDYAETISSTLAGTTRIVRVAEIDWVEAAGSYVRIHAGPAAFLHRAALARLFEQLDPARFARIHRSTVVAIDRIEEVTPSGHGDARVRLADGTLLTVSRRHRQALMSQLQS